MNGKDLNNAIEVLSNSLEMDVDTVKKVIEESLETSLKRDFGEDYIPKAIIDSSGNYTVYKVPLEEGIPNYSNKEEVEFQITRNHFQVVKQSLFLKVKEASKENIEDKYKDYFNQIYYVKIQSQDKRGYYVSFSNKLEGYLPKSNLPKFERFKNGQSTYAILVKDSKYKNHSFVFSKKGGEYVWGLIEKEDIDAQDGIIVNKGIHRIEGFRTVIVVHSKDNTIDPIYSIVGPKSIRIKNIQNALNGENIQLIKWNPNPANILVDYYNPEKSKLIPENISLDEDKKIIHVSFTKEDKEIVEKRNEEKTLNSIVSGWDIIINYDSEENEKVTQNILMHLVNALNIEEDLALEFIKEGFITVDSIKDADKEDLMRLGLEEEDVEAIIVSANGYIMQKRLDSSLEEFNELEVPVSFVVDIVESGISSIEDLAELSTDELVEKTSFLDNEDSGNIIMQARKYLGWI